MFKFKKVYDAQLYTLRAMIDSDQFLSRERSISMIGSDQFLSRERSISMMGSDQFLSKERSISMIGLLEAMQAAGLKPQSKLC